MRTKHNLLLIALLITFGASAQTLDLPRIPTEFEQKNDSPEFSPIGITTPPPGPVRAMAEWEELQALLISWNSQPTILSEIVRAARKECNVVICCADSSIVEDAKGVLISKGVDLSSNVSFLVAPNNSIWIRDYGPNCVYAQDVDSLYFVDWIYNRPTRKQDDTLATSIAPFFGVPLYSTSAAPTDMVNTGGNFMSDGMGTAFASQLILKENDTVNTYGVTPKTGPQIDGIFSDFMGINRYIKMETLPYDGIHHIDMHMKLLDEQTLLVGQYPAGIADGPQIEANIQYVLSNYKNSFDSAYKVIRIPMPPDNAGHYPDQNGSYRTYANAVFVNKTIIIPYYTTQYDTTALRIWQEAMPGYKVVGINCNSIISQKGAIHCITKEIGVYDPLRIVHQPLGCQDNNLVPGGYAVNAKIQHRSGVAEAILYYANSPSGPWQSKFMTQGIVPGDDWFGSIPVQAAGSTVYYYIEATAVNGKKITRPITAPDGWWKFCVSQSSATTSPQVGMQEIYPNPAAAVTVIPVNATARCQGNLLLFNSLGQEVTSIYTGDVPSGNTNYFLDASQLPAGTYFVKLQTGTQVQLKKLIVK